jgi:sigma-B regulation protein RsbQ
MSILDRNHVKVSGQGARAMIFAHGYGCDQNMWRLVAPAFERDYRVVLFDYVGAGKSDLSAYRPARYGSLAGYAEDVLEICHELGLTDAIFVGHSVSSMIGAVALQRDPGLFSQLVMVGPSPWYINEGDYHGGFGRADIDGLLALLDANHLGWSATMAPVIMGNPDRPELAEELANSFCRTDPEIARHFARVTFLSDCRAQLPGIRVPTLVIQCTEDAIAPRVVGEYVHRQIAGSSIAYIQSNGHCPHLSAPAETIAAIRAFL